MLHPRYWLKYFRVKRALADYPLYDVPHKRAAEELTEQEIQENFEYFMSVRKDRLAHFQNWLRDNFGVNAKLNGDGILALEKWIDDFGGGLLCCYTINEYAIEAYSPTWANKYLGHNVIFDIAIFLGEYLLCKRPVLYWEINHAWLNEDGEMGAINEGQPIIKGFPRFPEREHNVLQTSYGFVVESRKRSEIGSWQNVYYKDTLSYNLRTTLHLAALTASDEPFVMGDYWDEPL